MVCLQKEEKNKTMLEGKFWGHENIVCVHRIECAESTHGHIRHLEEYT